MLPHFPGNTIELDAEGRPVQADGGIIAALPAHIAVLDEWGVIVLINRAWAQYAESNRYSGAYFVGLNYLDLCARTEGVDVADACLAFVEIRSVLAGEQDERRADQLRA